MIVRGVKRRNVDGAWLSVQRECMHVIRFQSLYSTIYGLIKLEFMKVCAALFTMLRWVVRHVASGCVAEST